MTHSTDTVPVNSEENTKATSVQACTGVKLKAVNLGLFLTQDLCTG
jgi:hypothetical protein